MSKLTGQDILWHCSWNGDLTIINEGGGMRSFGAFCDEALHSTEYMKHEYPDAIYVVSGREFERIANERYEAYMKASVCQPWQEEQEEGL